MCHFSSHITHIEMYCALRRVGIDHPLDINLEQILVTTRLCKKEELTIVN